MNPASGPLRFAMVLLAIAITACGGSNAPRAAAKVNPVLTQAQAHKAALAIGAQLPGAIAGTAASNYCPGASVCTPILSGTAATEAQADAKLSAMTGEPSFITTVVMDPSSVEAYPLATDGYPQALIFSIPGKARADNLPGFLAGLAVKASQPAGWTVQYYAFGSGDSPLPTAFAGLKQIKSGSDSAVSQAGQYLAAYWNNYASSGAAGNMGSVIADGPLSSEQGQAVASEMAAYKSSGYIAKITFSNTTPVKNPADPVGSFSFRAADGSTVAFLLTRQQSGFGGPRGCLRQDRDGHYFSRLLKAGFYVSVTEYRTLTSLVQISRSAHIVVSAQDTATYRIDTDPVAPC